MKKQILILLSLCLILSSCPSPQNSAGDNQTTIDENTEITSYTLKDFDGIWIKDGDTHFEYVVKYNSEKSRIDITCQYLNSTSVNPPNRTLTKKAVGRFKYCWTVQPTPPEPSIPDRYYSFKVYKNRVECSHYNTYHNQFLYTCAMKRK